MARLGGGRMNALEIAASGLANNDAEDSIIGACLKNPKALDALEGLCEQDFTQPHARVAFRAIRGLADQNRRVDLVTVVEAAEGASKRVSDMPVYLSNCVQKTPVWANAGEYGAIVKELAIRRRIVDVSARISAAALDRAQDCAKTLDDARLALAGIVVSRHATQGISDVLASAYEYVVGVASGDIKPIPTGMPGIDGTIGGLFRGEYTIIAARPSVGKSAFAASVALAAAKNGAHVAICSREMTDVQYGQRLLSSAAYIDGMRIRTGDLHESEWPLLGDAMAELSALPVEFMFTVRTVEDLRQECMRLREQNGLDVLVVDYLQLMDSAGSFEKEYLRIGKISHALQALAHDLSIVVLALAQVGRSAQNAMPTLAELRGSGDMEQDADGVIFLHRPENAQDRTVNPMDKSRFDEFREMGYEYISIHIAKQRNACTGYINILFEPAKMRYYAIERKGKNEDDA